MNREFEFVIIGEERMHCGGCESRVANALKRLDGVREVRASASDQHIVVTLDSGGASAEQIAARLAQLGYEAKLERQHG